MLSQWPIRNKLFIGIGLLLVIVATLSWSGFHGVYAYRAAVRGFRGRADELPLAKNLSKQISDLRVIVAEARSALAAGADTSAAHGSSRTSMAGQFALRLGEIRATLEQYRLHLWGNEQEDSRISDSHEEWVTMRKIDTSLERIVKTAGDAGWISDGPCLEIMHAEFAHLQELSWELPSYLHERIHNFASEVKGQYRTLIGLTWVTTVLGMLSLAVFLRLFYAWVFKPLRVLVEGSRRVAAGEFGYRISLENHDEMSELADALNDMTSRFETIRDGLDRQVQERTKQVVRSEQLASVGFLAAGVAHEINNPLASIALCAESLEGRVEDVLQASPAENQTDSDVIRNYLRMIQNEAFRCKGITERLLDFSRMGDLTRQSTDLRELVQGVIDMVGHLGRYQDKHIQFAPGERVLAPVNPQEMKQVVLNLVTNALDSLSPAGILLIVLRTSGPNAEIVFDDDGCGMNEEVLEHLFEPFFTRSRTGQGTGLGLSISYRIVADHGGQIDAHSAGPGQGSQFKVTLPLAEKQKERDHRHQAA